MKVDLGVDAQRQSATVGGHGKGCSAGPRSAGDAGPGRAGRAVRDHFEYLADGHHVDDAGNLIVCTHVDFRAPAERLPITVLQKTSSKDRAIPGASPMSLALCG